MASNKTSLRDNASQATYRKRAFLNSRSNDYKANLDKLGTHPDRLTTILKADRKQHIRNRIDKAVKDQGLTYRGKLRRPTLSHVDAIWAGVDRHLDPTLEAPILTALRKGAGAGTATWNELDHFASIVFTLPPAVDVQKLP